MSTVPARRVENSGPATVREGDDVSNDGEEFGLLGWEMPEEPYRAILGWALSSLFGSPASGIFVRAARCPGRP